MKSQVSKASGQTTSASGAEMGRATLKRVVVRYRSTDAQLLVSPGFAEQGAWEQAADLDLLSPQGVESRLEWARIEGIFLVNDFSEEAFAGASDMAATGARRRSGGTQRLPGLRVRLRCRSNWIVEGILASDLLQLRSTLTFTPATTDSPWQRLIVPREQAIRLDPLEFVRPGRSRRLAARSDRTQWPAQMGLFQGEKTR